MTPRRVVLGMALLALAACGAREAAGPGGRVVVYTSVDRIFAEPLLRRARERLGLNVVGVYDTEETKSTGLVHRLIARKSAPDGDLFWSGDPARAAQLKKAGVTAPYVPDGAEEIDPIFRDSENHWTGFSARARVLIVNRELVPPGEEPKGIRELADPRWKGKAAMASPLFGTTSFHVAALFEALGEEEARAWLEGLKANGGRIVSSNGEVKRQVAAGTVAVGLTDSDDAAEAIKDGQPVRAAFLDQEGGEGPPLGALILPNTISLIAGGPNEEGAKKVADFLVSHEATAMLAESCGQAPLRASAPATPNALDLTRVKPMAVDYAACADRLERILPTLKEWVDPK